MKKIMIVEDDELILDSTEMALRNFGFDVLALSNASEIFYMIRSFSPDVILMDYSIGDHNGRKICEYMRAQQDMENIRVLVFSAAVSGKADFSNPLFSCFDGFIPKPFDLDLLIREIG